MKIKQIPEDFKVEEIYNITKFKEKDEGKIYYYFKFTKKDYNQLRALELVAKTFNTSRKLVHFAGTKDKVGITTQIISVFGIKEKNLETNLEYFNRNECLHLEFLGTFNGRINLGDNLGNRFFITIRDVDEKDIEIAKNNTKEVIQKGILNFFDKQRFGYAQNSHIVGKYVLQNSLELAVYEILTSLPQNPSAELKNFIDFIKVNWNEIKAQNKEIIAQAINLQPKHLKSEGDIIRHLEKYKNDFPGAFRKVHKKLRTLYVSAYQSYVFNEVIIRLSQDNSEQMLFSEISLVSPEMDLDSKVGKIVLELLEKDNLSLENFKLVSMPEIKLTDIKRKVRIFPQNLNFGKPSEDELNNDKLKVKISFELDAGEYATNVIKQLFEI